MGKKMQRSLLMFLENYLSNTKLLLLNSKYDKEYIENFDYNKFINIYNIFKSYNFYFIDDIIMNYLEIFEMKEELVIKRIEFLKEKLGNNFVYIIGNDMRYLEYIKNTLE